MAWKTSRTYIRKNHRAVGNRERTLNGLAGRFTHPGTQAICEEDSLTTLSICWRDRNLWRLSLGMEMLAGGSFVFSLCLDSTSAGRCISALSLSLASPTVHPPSSCHLCSPVKASGYMQPTQGMPLEYLLWWPHGSETTRETILRRLPHSSHCTDSQLQCTPVFL